MITHARGVGSRFHLPLQRLALCLDCDECFETGVETCPACGSEAWSLLSRFLDTAGSDALSRLLSGPTEGAGASRRRADRKESRRHLLIVARDRLKLYEHLQRAFDGNDMMEVILDRRAGDRRQRRGANVAERRQTDRRSRPAVDGQLGSIGWSLVLMDLGKAPGRRALVPPRGL